MITDDLITAAATDLVADKLSASAQQQLLTYIRALDRYKVTPGLFPGLAAKLAAATGADAQFLQAALNGAKALGSGTVSLAGGSAAVNWSLVNDRNEFFSDALNYLYDVPAQRPTSAVVPMTTRVFECRIHGSRLRPCGCPSGAVLVF